LFESAARTVADEPKVRRTTFEAMTVGDVRFCMFTIVVAARMVMDDREERTAELQWLERQEAREVRGVREVAVIDRRERAEQDILVVYRVVDRSFARG
jgi:hypothetical protein